MFCERVFCERRSVFRWWGRAARGEARRGGGRDESDFTTRRALPPYWPITRLQSRELSTILPPSPKEFRLHHSTSAPTTNFRVAAWTRHGRIRPHLFHPSAGSKKTQTDRFTITTPNLKETRPHQHHTSQPISVWRHGLGIGRTRPFLLHPSVGSEA